MTFSRGPSPPAGFAAGRPDVPNRGHRPDLRPFPAGRQDRQVRVRSRWSSVSTGSRAQLPPDGKRLPVGLQGLGGLPGLCLDVADLLVGCRELALEIGNFGVCR